MDPLFLTQRPNQRFVEFSFVKEKDKLSLLKKMTVHCAGGSIMCCHNGVPSGPVFGFIVHNHTDRV